MILCWSIKGGSGTSVVAAAIALQLAERAPTLLVDLGGDAPDILGVQHHGGPGVNEWMGSAVSTADSLRRLAKPVQDSLAVVPCGARTATPRWDHLAAALGRGQVVIDAGHGEPPRQLAHQATQSLLVIRPCFLALRRLGYAHTQATGVIMVTEPGRALGQRDIERVSGAPVVAQVDLDPLVARAVDSGMFATRPPRTLTRQLQGVTATVSTRGAA